MIPPSQHLACKDPESNFGQQLQILSGEGSLKGYLMAKKNGILTRVNFLEFLWEQIKSVTGHRNGANSCFVEFKVIEFLSTGRDYVKTQEQVKLVQALARRAGLTPVNGQDHQELKDLVDEISKHQFPVSHEKRQENYLVKFVERHKQELLPFLPEIHKITQAFTDTYSIHDGKSESNEKEGDEIADEGKSSSSEGESAEHDHASGGHQPKLQAIEVVNHPSSEQLILTKAVLDLQVPDLQTSNPLELKTASQPIKIPAAVKPVAVKMEVLKPKDLIDNRWKSAAKVAAVLALPLTLFTWYYFRPGINPVNDAFVSQEKKEPELIPSWVLTSTPLATPPKATSNSSSEVHLNSNDFRKEALNASLPIHSESAAECTLRTVEVIDLDSKNLTQKSVIDSEKTFNAPLPDPSKSISDQAFSIHHIGCFLLGISGFAFVVSKIKGQKTNQRPGKTLSTTSPATPAAQIRTLESKPEGQSTKTSSKGGSNHVSAAEKPVVRFTDGQLALTANPHEKESRKQLKLSKQQQINQTFDTLEPGSQEWLHLMRIKTSLVKEKESTIKESMDRIKQGGSQKHIKKYTKTLNKNLNVLKALNKQLSLSIHKERADISSLLAKVNAILQNAASSDSAVEQVASSSTVSAASTTLTLPHWLKNEGIKVTDELVIHFLGDPLAKAAGLKGGPISSPLKLVISCLQERPEFLTQESWQSQKKLLEKALEIETAVFSELNEKREAISNERAKITLTGQTYRLHYLQPVDEQLINQNAQLLGKAIQDFLEENKEVLLIGGWVGKPFGHALYYKIALQNNGKYSFQVFNRREGVEYHGQSTKQQFKDLYPGAMQLTDIDLHRILDPYFLRALVEQRLFAENPFLPGEAKATSYDKRDIYESLFSLLGGKQQEVIDVTLEKLNTRQGNGVCAWKSLTPHLDSAFGYLPFKQFKLRLQIQLLWSYYKQNQKLLSDNVDKHHLLLRAINSAASNVKVMKNLIPSQEYVQIVALLARIETDLDQTHEEHIKKRRESANQISLQLHELHVPPAANQPPEIEPGELHKLSLEELQKYKQASALYKESVRKADRSVLNTKSIFGLSTLSESKASIDVTQKLSSWKPEVKNLVKNLQEFNGICEEANTNHQYRTSHHLFQQVMRLLPVPTTDCLTEEGRFWKIFIEEQSEEIPELMSTIAQLSHHYYTSCFYVDGSTACPPARTHALIKSLHIQNILKPYSVLGELNLSMPAEFDYLDQLFSEGKYREIAFRSTDPLVSDELRRMHTDLKKMAAPFAKQNKGNAECKNSGLAFEWAKSPYRHEFDEKAATQAFYRSNDLNPEFAWIQKLLKEDGRFAKDAAAHYTTLKQEGRHISPIFSAPSFNELSTCEKIAFIYTAGDEKLLPPLFCQWREQVLHSQLLLYGPFAPPLSNTINDPSDLNTRITLHLVGTKYNPTIAMSYEFPYALSTLFTDYLNIQNPILSHSYEARSRYYPNMRPMATKAQKQKLDLLEGQPKLTQNEVLSQIFPDVQMNKNEIRKELCLATNKTLQIEQTVAYFLKNIHLLRDHDYQTLFYTLIFEENLLLNEFRKNSDIKRNFLQLIENGCQLANNALDIQTHLFFISLGRHLQQFESFVYPKKTKDVFFAFKPKLLSLLNEKELSIPDKSLIYAELLASYASADCIDREDAVLITRALVFLSMHPIPPEGQKPATAQEQRDVLNKFYFELNQTLSTDPSAFLNDVLKPIIPNYKDSNWEERAFPIFQATEKDASNVATEKYALNVLNGDFFEKGQPQASLPTKILTHPVYKAIFNHSYPAKKIGVNLYEFCDQRENKYRVLLTGLRDLCVQREIDGKWYEWKERGTLQSLFNEAIINNHTHWMACDGSRRLELYDLKGERKAYAQLNEKAHLMDLKSRACPPFHKELSWVNHSRLKGSGLQFLTSFESPSHINVWKDDKETPCSIQLPRYDLEFHLDKNSEKPIWTCLTHPEYQLATNQYIPALGLLEGYLVLEDKKGEPLIIFPVQRIDAKNSSRNPTFSEKITLEWNPELSKQRYACYRLTEKGVNGDQAIEPVPSNTISTIEANFYLAYLKLAIGHYQEARNLLKVSQLPLSGKCSNELGLLREIITLNEVNHDTTAEGTALRIHAAYLYLELLERSGRPQGYNEAFWTHIHADCNLYLNLITKVGSLRLPPNEEQLVMRTVLNKLDTTNCDLTLIVKYLQELDPKFKEECDGNLFSKAVNFVKKQQSFSVDRDNREAKALLDTVDGALKTRPKEWGENWKKFKDFCAFYHDEEYTVEELKKTPFLYTRLGKEGVECLLLLWLKTPKAERKDLLNHIKNCLDLSAFDQSSSTLLARAVLMMIRLQPDKYHITAPPNDTEGQNDWDNKREQWLTTQIVPILEDYSKEMQNSAALHDRMELKRVKVKETGGTEVSLRKGLPGRELGRLNTSSAVKNSLSFSSLSFQQAKQTSSFHPTDFLIGLDRSESQALIASKKQALETTATQANALFAANSNDKKCVANEHGRLKRDVDAFVNQSKEALDGAKPMRVDDKRLSELKDTLAHEIRHLKINLVSQEARLLQIVNPSQSIKNTQEASNKESFLAGKREKIGIERLIILYGRNQLDLLRDETLLINQKNVDDLKKGVVDYLEQATHIQHLQRALEKTAVCIEQQESKGSINEEAKQFLVEELSNKRQFNKELFPENLVFEYYNNMFLRQDQLDKLAQFFESGNIQPVLQMIMGAGKTSVLMPLMALFLANGKNLAILMIPDALLESVFEEIRVKLGDGFLQMIFPFNFGRNSDYSLERLKTLKEKLDHIKKNKECLISSPKSFHCFYLKFIETWRAMKNSEGQKKQELKEQFKLMRSILNLFRKDGHVLMDEVDLALYCRNEVNFPIGKDAYLQERDIDLLFEIYDVLKNSEELKSCFKAEFDPSEADSTARSFDIDSYAVKVKPLLAKALLERLKTKVFGDEEVTKRLRSFLQGANEELLTQFFCQDEKSFDDAYNYVQSIEDKDILNLLHLVHEELNHKLPITLQKNFDEDYGIRSQIFATPLDKGKPIVSLENGELVESTRFADPFESANYTIQSYQRHGIPKTLVKKQIQALQKQACEDFDKGLLLKECAAYQTFCELCGNENLTGMHMLKLSEENYDSITTNINRNDALRKLFIKRYVLSAISFQTGKLNSNAQMLVSLFLKVYGFSGTTWNSDTYHDNLVTMPSLGTDARTIFALLGPAGKEHKIETVNFQSPSDFIDKLDFKNRELALIDSGAYLKGKSILEEAKQLLTLVNSKDQSMKGVVFFDDDNKQVILEIDTKKEIGMKGRIKDPIPLKESVLKPSERFTVYTKPFTTGANILQDPNAIAYFTVGRNFILRDYLQGAFRMRKIDRTQKVRILIRSEVEKIIKTTLKKPENTAITQEDLLVFSVYNQANQIGEDNYVAIKQKMHQTIQEEIVKILLDETLDPDDAAELYTKAVEEVFVPTCGKDPSSLYGSKEYRGEANDVLTKEAERNKGLLAQMIDSARYLRSKIQKEEVEKTIGEKVKPEIVPERLAWNEHDNSNQLVQVQQQTQVQVQTLQQVQSYISQEPLKKWRYFPWPQGDIYQSSFYRHAKLGYVSKVIKGLQETSYLPKLVQPLWNLSTDLSKRVWRVVPAHVRGPVSILGEKVIAKAHQIITAPPWTYALKDFIFQDESLNEMSSLFTDEALRVSFNFAPQIAFKAEDRLAIPFDPHQKPIEHALVAFNKAKKQWEVTVLDQEEAADFRKRLQDQDTDPQSGDLNVCLFNLQLGEKIQYGKQAFTAQQLKDENLLKLLVKLKFLNGETSYNEKEEDLLRDWISAEKWSAIKNDYKTRVIAHHLQTEYITERLDKIFKGAHKRAVAL